MRTRRTTTTLAVLALAGVLMACGDDGSAGDAGPASLDAESASDETGGAGTEGGSDGDEDIDPEDAAQEFAACMRENGVDTQAEVAEGGGMAITSGSDDEEDGPSPEEMDAAHEECEEHLPAAGGEREPADPDDVARMRDEALDLARCMRDRGYDFPDPEVDDEGGVTIRGPDMGGAGAPDHDEFQTDMDECREEAGLEAPGGGGFGIAEDG